VQSRSSVDIAAAIEEMSAGIAAVTDNALQAMQVAQDMQELCGRWPRAHAQYRDDTE
jgi:methyl-accepting chemotaxis protein